MAAAALALTMIAATAPMAAFSAVPTLGLRVTSEVYGDQPSPVLQLTSRASAPTNVEMSLPPGWQLQRTSLQLAPGQEVAVPFTSVGATSTMETRQALVEPPAAGTTSGALVVRTKLLSERPVPQDWTLAWTLALVLALAVLALVTLRWLGQNFRLARR